ncbi:MAG: hypothetical protein JW966_05555 [Anaerolineae bacterium]|nr:hypothetical protein [Anaerolineae bacterium]
MDNNSGAAEKWQIDFADDVTTMTTTIARNPSSLLGLHVHGMNPALVIHQSGVFRLVAEIGILKRMTPAVVDGWV